MSKNETTSENETPVEQLEAAPVLIVLPAQNIHEAIINVMKRVFYVQKIRSQGLKYSFASETDLIAAARPALLDEGVFMYVAEILDYDQREYQTSSGTPMVDATARARVRFVHAPSGTSIDVWVLGEGADSGDKSLNKAMTDYYKYAIRQTLMIETGDDPDKDQSNDRGTSSQPANRTNGNQSRNAPVQSRQNAPQQRNPQNSGQNPANSAQNHATGQPAANNAPAAAENAAASPTQPPAPAPRDPTVRPYTPEVLQENFKTAVAVAKKKGLMLGPNDYAMVEEALDYLTIHDEDIPLYLEYVTGSAYLSDLREEAVVALLRLLKPTASETKVAPCKEAILEAVEVVDLVKKSVKLQK